jgi:hypothetical protein
MQSRATKCAGQLARIAMALALFGAVVPSCNAQETCDTVSIESAGEYKIKHSRIKGISTTHNRGGVAIFVVLSPGDGPQDDDLVDLTLWADLKPTPTPECSIVPRIGVPRGVACWQSIRGVQGLRVVATFKIGDAEDYKNRLPHILDYLIKDVFNCGPPGTRI